MRAAIPPLPNTPSWRGAQLKRHRNNFTFTFYTRRHDVLWNEGRKQTARSL